VQHASEHVEGLRQPRAPRQRQGPAPAGGCIGWSTAPATSWTAAPGRP